MKSAAAVSRNPDVFARAACDRRYQTGRNTCSSRLQQVALIEQSTLCSASARAHPQAPVRIGFQCIDKVNAGLVRLFGCLEKSTGCFNVIQGYMIGKVDEVLQRRGSSYDAQESFLFRSATRWSNSLRRYSQSFSVSSEAGLERPSLSNSSNFSSALRFCCSFRSSRKYSLGLS